MVLVMLYGVLRVSEVCNLDKKDIDFEEFTIAIERYLKTRDDPHVTTHSCYESDSG